ncbi:MAG: hypothetical protein KA792_00730 [Bacteroidales bacterium]|nr:hypothetical protein [Bacteroidales bacterium]
MNSIFSASEPNLGYLYQMRYGLLLIVSEQNQDAKLLLEKIDDISIEKSDTLDVYQTKLHINSVANLTDASTDFWKTIRVWCEGIINGQLNLDNCLFNLITTATTSKDTIPFKLKQGTNETRDIETILKDLNDIISKSTNKINKPAYDSFSALSIDQQKKLIKNISIIDASVDLNEAKNKIKNILRYSTALEKIEALYQRLEGWFMGEVILQLQNQTAEITGKDVQDKILDIADSLKADNLPVDFTVSIASDEGQLSPYRHHKFVKQLDTVGVNSKLINHAISDYHRAFSQKSKWLRDGLINPTDEIQYDAKLIDDWERKFAILEDCAGKNDKIKKIEGKKFYESHYVNSQPKIHIKDRFKEQYMVTGSCQILSDKKKIGWHPDFQTLI